MSCVFQNIDPHPPHRTAFGARGGQTRWVEGQYFGKRRHSSVLSYINTLCCRGSRNNDDIRRLPSLLHTYAAYVHTHVIPRFSHMCVISCTLQFQPSFLTAQTYAFNTIPPQTNLKKILQLTTSYKKAIGGSRLMPRFFGVQNFL